MNQATKNVLSILWLLFKFSLYEHNYQNPSVLVFTAHLPVQMLQL